VSVNRISLIGPMGAGKSTIGLYLARYLNLPFVDSDQEIKLATGADITWIFDVEGEAGFREREHMVIKQLCNHNKTNRLVLATGGGVVLRKENRDLLRNFGLVIYLYSSVAQQLERTLYDRHRPLLQCANPEQILHSLFMVRDPLYRLTADIIIKTDGLKLNQITEQILEHLN